MNMGLVKSEHLSKILIDPRDSKIMYVARVLWSSGGQRVYTSQLTEGIHGISVCRLMKILELLMLNLILLIRLFYMLRHQRGEKSGLYYQEVLNQVFTNRQMVAKIGKVTKGCPLPIWGKLVSLLQSRSNWCMLLLRQMTANKAFTALLTKGKAGRK